MPTAGDVWDSVVADAQEFGNSLPTDVTTAIEAEATQPEAGSSTEAGSTGRSETPQSPPAGDDGQALPVAEAPPTEPAPVAAVPEIEPEPFTFTVDGKPETIAGAMVIKGDGLYVPEEQVPHFQLLASQAKTLDRQVRELHDKQKAEASQWDRRTAFSFKDDKGVQQTVTGQQGWESHRLKAVADETALSTVVAHLSDPTRFASLVDYVRYDQQGKVMSKEMAEAVDENGRAVYAGSNWIPSLKQDAWQNIVRESSMSIREKQFALRQEFGELAKPLPPAEPTADSFAGGTIEQLATQHGLSALTPADKQFLASHFATYTRAATPEERAQYGVPRLVLPAFVELMKDKNDTRAEMAKVSAAVPKAVAAVGKAATFNKGMDAGKATVVAPAARKPAVVAVPTTGKYAPKERTEKTGDDMWADLITQGMEAG